MLTNLFFCVEDVVPSKKSKLNKRKQNSAEDEETITEQEVEDIREKKRRKREQKENNSLPPEQENVERLNDTLQVNSQTNVSLLTQHVCEVVVKRLLVKVFRLQTAPLTPP